MNIDEAIERACQEPTLREALVWIAIWDADRAVQQAKENPTWETTFGVCFQRVMARYAQKQKAQNTFPVELPEHWTVRKEVTYLIFERDEDPPCKLTFHYRKGYQWRMHEMEGEVRAYELAELCTLLRFMSDDAWNNMEDSYDYGEQT